MVDIVTSTLGVFVSGVVFVSACVFTVILMFLVTALAAPIIDHVYLSTAEKLRRKREKNEV